MKKTIGAPVWATFGRNRGRGEIRNVANQQLGHVAAGSL